MEETQPATSEHDIVAPPPPPQYVKLSVRPHTTSNAATNGAISVPPPHVGRVLSTTRSASSVDASGSPCSRCPI